MKNIFKDFTGTETVVINGREFGVEEAILTYERALTPEQREQVEHVNASTSEYSALAFIYRKYFPHYFAA